jgi:hypothetical protein
MFTVGDWRIEQIGCQTMRRQTSDVSRITLRQNFHDQWVAYFTDLLLFG